MRFLTAGPEILSQTGTGNIFGTKSCSFIVVIFFNILRNWHNFSNQSLDYNTSMVSFQLAN